MNVDTRVKPVTKLTVELAIDNADRYSLVENLRGVANRIERGELLVSGLSMDIFDNGERVGEWRVS